MANCLPFNSIEHDRIYKAEDWAWYFATFIANGIFPKPSDGLQVIAYNGMEIKINMGYAFINGYAFRNPAGKSITLNNAEGALHRIDRVVVRWSASRRDVYIDILKGVPSAKPVPTQAIRNTEIWDLVLADIYVGKGVTKIQTANITDQRFNSSVCGIVTGTVKEIDASVLTKQFNDFFKIYKQKIIEEHANYNEEMDGNITYLQNEFLKWFNNIKDLLESVNNGELLAQVMEMLDAMYQKATESDIDAIISSTYVDMDESNGYFETGTNADIDEIIDGTYLDDIGNSDDVTDEDIQSIVDSLFKLDQGGKE